MENEIVTELRKEFYAYQEMEVPEGMDKKTQLGMYAKMSMIREFEAQIKPLWMMNKIQGYAHPYTAAEAIAVGVCQNLNKDDYIGSTHRGHGHVIAKGGDINGMMAELFGKYEGYNKGKGGSMHICDMSIGMLGATGIVGTGIPGAVGSALASRNKGNGRVTVVFFGDGAANCGQLAESMNMAAAWNLPVVFICENNQWAVATEIGRVVKEKDIYKRAYGYGIPGKLVDGFNVYDVYKHSKEAIHLARNDGGPTLLECKFMRIIGHHSLDDNKYRDMDHINKYWELDPIKRMREFMIKNKIAAKGEFDAIDEDSRVKVAASVDYADNKCTEPPLKTLWDDVYANGEIIE